MKKLVAYISTFIVGFALIASQVQAQSATTGSGQKVSAKSRRSDADKQKESSVQGKVDINTASGQELDALPGIGPALAQKIIQNRPYGSKRDLMAKNVISKSAYDGIKDQIVAHKGGGNAPSTPATEKSAAEPRSSQEASEPSPQDASAASQNSSKSEAASCAELQTPPEKGMVWVNLKTKVFHREGDRWYGKTKHGKFMSETDAIKAGYRESKER